MLKNTLFVVKITLEKGGNFANRFKLLEIKIHQKNEKKKNYESFLYLVII